MGISNDRYFELELMIDSMAKNLGVPNANCYFRLSNIRKPSREEYRRKVVEFMLAYEHILSMFNGLEGYEDLKAFVHERLSNAVQQVLNGKNKDVEKRYEYYIMNE